MYISLIVCNPLIPTDSSKSHLGSDMPSALGPVPIVKLLTSKSASRDSVYGSTGLRTVYSELLYGTYY